MSEHFSVDAVAHMAGGAISARSAHAKRRRHTLRRWSVVVASFLCGVGLMQVLQIAAIVGDSMRPQLRHGDWVIVAKLPYQLGPVRAGDIVLLSHPEQTSELLAKRIVGLPGDVIELRDGHLFIGGRESQEDNFASVRRDHSNRPTHVVRPGYYYLIGDNRIASEDSRAWGDVPGRCIRGKIVFRFWPLSRMGKIARRPPLPG